MNSSKVALITGGAKRIGRAITRALHTQGYDVIIHHNHSQDAAKALRDELNAIRPNSANTIHANLSIVNDSVLLNQFTNDAISLFGRLDLLVNNASSFYSTSLNDDHATWQSHWDDLFLTNTKAPLFLSLTFKDELAKQHGAIISLLDIHARDKPFVGYPIYNIAKAAHHMMVQSLALELAPNIRINGVSPGVNIFPHDNQNSELNDSTKQALTDSVPLGKIGTPEDIANAVAFLADADYITGQILAIDGGRSLTLKGG